MRTGSVRFTIEGLSLERLINNCVAKGIVLEAVARPSIRTIKATVASHDYPAIEAIAKEQNWNITVGKLMGLPGVKLFALRRLALVIGVVVFVTGVWYMCNCLWSIDIQNAGAYLGEVRQVLRERGVNVGRFAANLDIEELRNALEERLTGLSWVSVSKDGVRLNVYCVQGEAKAKEEGASSYGDIVASRDGIIESLRVTAGTALVKQGDAVRKGQPLIRGEEKTWQGGMKFVEAKGTVLAKVWYSAQVAVPTRQIETIPTGSEAYVRSYILPWFTYNPDTVPQYDKYDMDTRTVPIGAILPIYIKIDTYSEVELGESALTIEEVQAEAELAALRLAREKAGLATQIIDKWTDYSMIDDKVSAKVTIETIENIAVGN